MHSYPTPQLRHCRRCENCGAKRKLLQSHTLEAVMSMPLDLFHDSDVGVVTCVMVINAHRPHPAGKKTWFGYWRDDGFVLTKHRGRVDLNGKWSGVRSRWLAAYRNHEIIDGESAMEEVTPQDEWCAEAYMETDYSVLSAADFEKELRKYAAFRILNERPWLPFQYAIYSMWLMERTLI